MLPLEGIEAILKDGGIVGVEDAMELIQTNAHDGEIFRRAASNGYINVVMFYLHAKNRFKLTSKEKEKCTNRGAANEDGMTPLHFASFHGFSDIVECLVSSESLQELRNAGKITPLYCACHQGHLDLVKLLIGYGVFSLRQCIDALKIAAYKGQFEVAKYLCAAGIPAEEAMYYAAREGHEEVVKFFLENGVHPDASAGDEWSFKDTNVESLYSSRMNSARTRRLHALFGPDLRGDLTTDEASERRNEMPLHSATNNGIFSVDQLLLEATSLNPCIGFTPLDIAVQRGHRQVAVLLRLHGAVLSKTGHFLKEAIEKGRFLSMICLQALGSDLHFFERTDQSVMNKPILAPVHIASIKNHRVIVQYLLQRNILVDARDNEGNTALHYACLRGHSKIARVLVECGASVNSKNKNGGIPLAFALLNGKRKIVQYLLQNDALPNIRCNWPGKFSWDLFQIAVYDSTLLHFAAFLDNISAAKLLIDFGAEVNAICPDGTTPLHIVKSVEFAELLLKNNAYPVIQDKQGLTPLLCAKKNQRRKIVSLLERYVSA